MIKDTRKQITQKIFIETFVELLKHKNVNTITVSELCRNAGLNRSTFYLHFLDLYDLYEMIEKDFINHLMSDTMTYDSLLEESVDAAIIRSCHYYQNNAELFLILNGSNGLNTLGTSLFNTMLDTTHTIMNTDIFIYKEDFEKQAALTYFIEGLLSVVQMWLTTEPSRSYESVANLIITINNHGINRRQ